MQKNLKFLHIYDDDHLELSMLINDRKKLFVKKLILNLYMHQLTTIVL